jgi:hypothetical protein
MELTYSSWRDPLLEGLEQFLEANEGILMSQKIEIYFFKKDEKRKKRKKQK